MVHHDIPTFAHIFYEYIVKHLYNVYIYKMNSLGLLMGVLIRSILILALMLIRNWRLDR